MSLKLAIETTYDGAGFEKLDTDQRRAESGNRRVNDSVVSGNAKAQDSLKKTAQIGKAAWGSIHSAAQAAGSAMGPVAGSISAVFTSITAGGIAAGAFSVALTGISLAIAGITERARAAKLAQQAFNDEFEKSGTITDAMYNKLVVSGGELTKAQRGWIALQKAIKGESVDVYNVVTGQWESFRKKAIETGEALNSTGGEVRNVTDLLKKYEPLDSYRTKIGQLNAALSATNDILIRGQIKEEIRAINEQIVSLTNVRIAPPSLDVLTNKVNATLINLTESIANGPPIIIPVKITPNPNQGVFGPTKEDFLDYQKWEQEQNQNRVANFYEATESIRAGWDAGLNGILSGTKRGFEITRTIFAATSTAAIQQFSRMLWAKLASLSAINAAEKTSAATSMALENRQTSMSIGHAVAQSLAWLKAAAAKMAAWFSALGPFGLVALGGTIAALVAMIRGVRLQSGGIVPGQGFGDKTPALLEPGEFVVNRRATQSNRSVLERINSGSSINNSSTANVTANITVNGNMGAGEMLSFREQLRMHLKSVFEELAYNGSFRPGLVGSAV